MRYRARFLLDAVATAAIVATCGFLVWSYNARAVPEGGNPDAGTAVPDKPFFLADAPLRGAPTAQYVLIVFTDYQCPFCQNFDRDTFPQLIKKFVDRGDLIVTVRHNPLESIHPFALAAAVAAKCAHEQGKFWEFHDGLFGVTGGLDEAAILRITDSVGVDTRQHAACRANPKVEEAVRAEGAAARQSGLAGTPAFVVGRVSEEGGVKAAAVIRGARSFEEFDRVISETLAGTRGSSRG